MAWFVCAQKDYNHWVREGLSHQCTAHATCLAASWTRDQHVRGSEKSGACRGHGTRDIALLSLQDIALLALNTASWIEHSQHGEAHLVFPSYSTCHGATDCGSFLILDESHHCKILYSLPLRSSTARFSMYIFSCLLYICLHRQIYLYIHLQVEISNHNLLRS